MNMMNLLAPVTFAILVTAELIWSVRHRRSVYHPRETLANLAIAVGNGLIRPAAVAWTYLVMNYLEPLQIFTLPQGFWAFLLTFVVTDLAYYWYHRASHVIRPLWMLHHTHHSSSWFNFSTAARLNWIAKFVSPLFFAPLILIGFSGELVATSLALGLLYQLFLHTEAVPSLGRLEGLLINTPSAHRVHHGSNPRYIDRNFAGIFIVWDRLFGTYQPECECVRYGVTTGFLSHNPLAIQFGPLIKYVRGRFDREAVYVDRHEFGESERTVEAFDDPDGATHNDQGVPLKWANESRS